MDESLDLIETDRLKELALLETFNVRRRRRRRRNKNKNYLIINNFSMF